MYITKDDYEIEYTAEETEEGADLTVTFFSASVEDGIELDLPGRVDGKKITGIGAYAFEGYESIVKITLPGELLTIKEGAFSGCSGLEYMEIPAKVKTIKEGAFDRCPLKKLTVAKGNGNYRSEEGVLLTADGATLLVYPAGRSSKAYTVPSSVKKISGMAFAGATQLQELTLGSQVSSIEAGAFSYSGIRAFKTEGKGKYREKDGVLYSGDEALHSYPTGSAQTFYQVEEGTVKIVDKAFAGAKSLRKVVFPESLKEVWDGAFADCEALTRVVFPWDMNYLGVEVFQGCSSLKAVRLPGAGRIQSLRSRLFYCCPQLTHMVVPAGVMAIEDGVFEGCENLTSVTLPRGLTYIWDRAFAGDWNLKEVTIPQEVLKIYEDTFDEDTETVFVVFKDSYGSTWARKKGVTFVEKEALEPLNPVVYTDKETILAVQKALNKAGYDAGPEDGKTGAKTRTAIEQFQSDEELETTGEVTEDVLKKLKLKKPEEKNADKK